jgi:lipid intermediate transporter
MEKLKKFISSVFTNNMDNPNEPKYRCVNCAYPIKELYKTYSPTIQKLTECEKCQSIADVFIEFESLFIICDLILLSVQAQRHVLYNTNCKNLYKILMLITLLESYCLFSENFDSKNNRFNKVDNDDPLYLEKGYYLATFQVILCKLRKCML